MQVANTRASRMLSRFGASTSGKIATSLAESIAFRTAVKPWTVGGKIVLTVLAMKALKSTRNRNDADATSSQEQEQPEVRANKPGAPSRRQGRISRAVVALCVA